MGWKILGLVTENEAVDGTSLTLSTRPLIKGTACLHIEMSDGSSYVRYSIYVHSLGWQTRCHLASLL